jgi:drug/metabolite transporter (DMT)-like permease
VSLEDDGAEEGQGGNITRGILLTCLATLCYAMVPNLARFGVLAGVPALENVVVRTAVVALVLTIAAIIMGQRIRLTRGTWLPLLGQVMSTLCVSLCYLGSLQYIPVGLSVLIFFTAPVIVVLLAPWVERRNLSPHHVILSITAFAGLALAVGPSFESMNPLGLALAALSALGYAGQQFTGRSLAGHLEPVVIGSLVHTIILPFVVIVATLAGQGQSVYLSGSVGPLVMLSGLGLALAYCGGYFLQMSGVKHAPASTVIPYFNLEPVMTTLLAFLFLREHLGLLHIIGAGLVIGSLLVMNLLDRRRSA